MSGSGAALKTIAFHHGRTAAGKYSHAAERAGWLDSTRTLSGRVAELLRTGRSERSQLRDRSTIDLQIFDLAAAEIRSSGCPDTSDPMSPYEYSCWSANNDALTQTLYFRHVRASARPNGKSSVGPCHLDQGTVG